MRHLLQNHLEDKLFIVGSVVEWLKHRTDDQYGLGSKPTCAILLCPWERHFTALLLSVLSANKRTFKKCNLNFDTEAHDVLLITKCNPHLIDGL